MISGVKKKNILIVNDRDLKIFFTDLEIIYLLK